MAVICRQTAQGEPTQQYRIAHHHDAQTDAELLLAKANGAASKGWTVEWHGSKKFTATKERWGGVLCTRSFWIE